MGELLTHGEHGRALAMPAMVFAPASMALTGRHSATAVLGLHGTRPWAVANPQTSGSTANRLRPVGFPRSGSCPRGRAFGRGQATTAGLEQEVDGHRLRGAAQWQPAPYRRTECVVPAVVELRLLTYVLLPVAGGLLASARAQSAAPAALAVSLSPPSPGAAPHGRDPWRRNYSTSPSCSPLAICIRITRLRLPICS